MRKYNYSSGKLLGWWWLRIDVQKHFGSIVVQTARMSLQLVEYGVIYVLENEVQAFLLAEHFNQVDQIFVSQLLQHADLAHGNFLYSLSSSGRTESIRKTFGLDPIKSALRKCRLRWLGHVYRREETNVIKTCERESGGKRKTTGWPTPTHVESLSTRRPKSARNHRSRRDGQSKMEKCDFDRPGQPHTVWEKRPLNRRTRSAKKCFRRLCLGARIVERSVVLQP